jgi:phosphoadenosine phosphosulfate reductase
MLDKEARAVTSIIKQCKLIQNGEDKIAVSFSGGKDSLVALDLAVRAGIRKAVFCNTTAEFDQTLPYIKRVRDFYGIDLTVVSSELNFFEAIGYIGLPSRRARWCCDVFKFAPIAKYGRDSGIKIFITGLRRDESNRRKFYTTIDRNPVLPFTQFNPILEWSDKDVWEYIHAYSLPYHPLYDIGFDRIGCWCCPYKTDKEWELMRKLFPEKIDFFERILHRQAEKMKLKDRERFVEGRGWTSWISPVRRVSVGRIRPCETNNMADIDVCYIKFSGKEDENIKRVKRLLPILTDLFWTTSDGEIKIIMDRSKRKKLRILLEKALNCISCGVCTSLCPTGALKVDELSVYVEKSSCTQCEMCIKGSATILRGACIVRNYAVRPATLVDLR